MLASGAVRLIFRCFLGALLLGLIAVGASNAWILWRARDRSCSRVSELPKNEVGLVLGTSPTIGRWSNPFFEGRMEAAAKLYHAGKIRKVLVTGDNGQRG